MNLIKIFHFYNYEWKTFSFLRKIIINKAFYNIFFNSYRFKIESNSENNGELLSFKSMSRQDYDNFFYPIVQWCESDELLVFYNRGLATEKLARIKFFFFLMSKYSEISFFPRLYAALSILPFISLNDVFKFNVPKLFLVHAEMQPIESYLVSLAKVNNIKTATLQHGLYIDYSSFDNINAINYMYIQVDYFLSWGKRTSEIINMYNNDTIVFDCGNHTYKHKISFGLKKYISVVFDQNMFKSQNEAVLKIGERWAKKNGMMLNVKLHPRNRIEDYDIASSDLLIGEPVENSVFVLAHTTTYSIDVMSNGIPVFIYDSGIPNLKYPDEIKFKTIVDLDNLSSMQYTAGYFKEIANNYVHLYADDSLHEYKKIIKALLKLSC